MFDIDNLNSPASEAAPACVSDAQRIKAITLRIKNADKRLRRRFAVLKYQDAIGVAFLVAAVTVCVASGVAFVQGGLPFWGCILINAFCLAIVREIEHDLIHNLYFRTKPRLQNAMMLAVWPLLGNLPHPWYRRAMHLLHHRTSGHHDDFEERLIGNGMKFGPLKLLAMVEPCLAMFLRRKELEKIPFYNSRAAARACMPVMYVYYTILLSFLLSHLADLGLSLWGLSLAAPAAVQSYMAVVNILAVTYIFPNLVRQTSVQILSSWMHYFGDIESRLHETQVMNAWYLLPFNLFSCNFGSTHSIHHFYAQQPFYLRQMIAGEAHAAFREHGLRYNDAASVLRGNRFGEE